MITMQNAAFMIRFIEAKNYVVKILDNDDIIYVLNFPEIYIFVDRHLSTIPWEAIPNDHKRLISEQLINACLERAKEIYEQQVH